MTDKERLLALLKDFGITPSDGWAEVCPDTIFLEAMEGGVDGYPHMFCSFNFDADGSFKDVGVWE